MKNSSQILLMSFIGSIYFSFVNNGDIKSHIYPDVILIIICLFLCTSFIVRAIEDKK